MQVFTDRQDLVPVTQYEFADYPFESFNPVQSRVLEFLGKSDNLLVASTTSSGKTVIGELFLAEEIRKNAKKGMYLAPLRSLAQEKLDDWRNPNWHFKDLKLCICTGDYRFTPRRKVEIDDSQLIVMTSEMLNACSRNYRSEKNQFLREIGTVVIDEVHLLGVPGRGDHLENGIMKLVEVNPNVRLVLLSATMPNVEQVAEWVEKLTGRECNVVRSDYRPCPLNVHFPIYRSCQNYEENESQKVTRAMDLIERFSGDKFLAFVHSKRTGDQLLKRLESRRIESAFHNADLPKEKRIAVERRFMDDPNFRVLVATSTLAWGVNLPSRRVIVLGVHRGKSEVENYDIMQMCGRAGRPKYDPAGDAYVLLPDLQVLKFKEKIQTPTPIESRLCGANTLAFHLISEIHHRHIQTLSDVDEWFKKTLAFHQRGFAGMVDCHDALQRLEAAKCLKIDGESLEVTGVGAVASMFYFNPFDASALSRNLRKLFDSGRERESECVAFALACLPTFKSDNPTVAEMDDLSPFLSEPGVASARAMFSKDAAMNGEVRAAYSYFCLLHDSVRYGTPLGTMANGLKMDFDRLAEMLGAMDEMAGKWNKGDFFAELKAKIVYGVEAKFVPLARLAGIGKVKAHKLYAAGLHTLKQVANNPALVASALRCKADAATKICQEAKTLVLTDGA